MANELRVRGLVQIEADFSVEDLAAFGVEHQIPDVSTIGFRRPGKAVRLATLLADLSVAPEATRLKLIASTDGFEADVPLQGALEQAVVIYLLDGRPLDAKSGGPFRFWIPNHSDCGESELDACANVKFLDTIELTTAGESSLKP